MKKVKKVYKNSIVTVYEECEEKECTMCHYLFEYINNPYRKDIVWKKMLPLAIHNLTIHINSGKHWKKKDQYDIHFGR